MRLCGECHIKYHRSFVANKTVLLFIVEDDREASSHYLNQWWWSKSQTHKRRFNPFTHCACWYHYSDVIMATMTYQMTSLTIVYSTVIQVQIKENTKAPRQWPLWGEFTVDRWNPRTQRASYAENVSIWLRHHVMTWKYFLHYTPGRDLMRERTRSRIQYGGRQMRRGNTVLFLQFYQCFADTIYAMR